MQAVKEHIFDPFEYLMLRHKAGLLRTDFTQKLGKVSYHVPCHLRVQNIGLKTRDMLKLVPGTTVDVIERCSGHNGTYAVKKEYRAASVKIGKPVVCRKSRRPRRIITRATVRWRATRSTAGLHRMRDGSRRASPNIR